MKYDINSLNLEPAKLKAITTTESPLLIIAAPGSGKTMTLIERVLYLLLVKEVEPSEIFVATFTEKAAGELITRISNRLLELEEKININEMYIGTLHSLFLRLLEENREYTRLKRNYRVLDDFEQSYFVYQKLHDFEKIENIHEVLTSRLVWDKTTSLVKYINKLREEMVVLHDLKSSNDKAVKALGEAAILYSSLLDQENSLDFSGIQTEMRLMLESFPQVLEQLQNKISYFMIDEYQDTNRIQEDILLKLAGKHQRICVVGDDDQSLYRFRGATVQNILSFNKNFPKGACPLIRLETNYRSHPGIIDYYCNWMKQIPGGWAGSEGQNYRYNKDIKPMDRDFPDYSSVIKASVSGTDENWYSEVYAFIEHLISEGKIDNYNQIAFLFRSVTNEKVKGLSSFLEGKGIPVYSPRSNQFFEREEIKNVIGALLTMFPNWKEHVAFRNGIELSVWEYYEECFLTFSRTIKADLDRHKLLLQYCITRAKEHTPLTSSTPQIFSRLFYELLQFPLFAEILDIDLATGVIDQRAAFNLSAFSQLLVKYEYLHHIDVLTPKTYGRHIRNFLNSYLRFLIFGGITEYEGFDDYAPSGNVSFMTVHQSKGLEFPVVVVGSLNLNPRKQYSEIDEILEKDFYGRDSLEPLHEIKNFDFWRLFYTAFSRAKNLLVFTGNEKEGPGALPSKSFRKIYFPLKNWNQVDLSSMPLEKIKPVNLKEEYSFTSDILLYENCPLQYKFFKSLEFSPVRHGTALFGTLVHETIEDIHKTILRGDESKVTRDQIDSWFNSNYQTLSKNLRTYMNSPQLESARNQIQAYVQRHKNDWSVIKEAEVDVS